MMSQAWSSHHNIFLLRAGVSCEWPHIILAYTFLVFPGAVSDICTTSLNKVKDQGLTTKFFLFYKYSLYNE